MAEIQGTYRQSRTNAASLRDRYERAKRHFDMAAAVEIVRECVNSTTIDLLIDALLEVNMPARIVMPHPEYDSGSPINPKADKPTNALPFAFAHYLAAELGCDVDEDIIEVARPGRTKLGLFPRFLWQPQFIGDVSRNHAYILVDDVSTVCGTLAALRSHIAANGGTVIAVSTLGRSDGLRSVRFPIADATLRMLYKAYGDDLCHLWLQEIGHDPECLTEMEGQALAKWHHDNCGAAGSGTESLQRLRDRIAEAAAKGS